MFKMENQNRLITNRYTGVRDIGSDDDNQVVVANTRLSLSRRKWKRRLFTRADCKPTEMIRNPGWTVLPGRYKGEEEPMRKGNSIAKGNVYNNSEDSERYGD